MQMIKMNQVIVLELGAMHHVADQSGIVGNLDTNGGFDCPHRGQSMGVRSDAAGALHKMMRILRVAPLENQFNAAKHLARTPCIDNFTAGHFHLDAKMALEPGNWIDYDTLAHIGNLHLFINFYFYYQLVKRWFEEIRIRNDTYISS
jgi:hypothetical protein